MSRSPSESSCFGARSQVPVALSQGLTWSNDISCRELQTSLWSQKRLKCLPRASASLAHTARHFLCLLPGQLSVAQNLSLKRSFVRRCLRTRLRGAYANKYGQNVSTTPQHELTHLTFYIFLLGANIKKWKQAHMQALHSQTMLTQPYAIQVVAYAQSP